ELQALLVAVATLAFLGRIVGLAAVLLDHHAAEVIGDLDQHSTNGLAGGSVLLLRQRATEAAPEHADTDATARRAAFHGPREVDFTSGRVDHAHIHGNVGLALLAAQRDALEADAATGTGGILFIRGHRAHDQIIGAGQLADL